MFQIFISESTCRKIVAGEEQKPKDKRSFLYKVLNRYQKSIVFLPPGKPMPEERFLQHPSSLYILDVPILEAERLQKSHGVCCICGDYPSIAMLIDTNDEHTTNDNEPFGQGWSTVLQSLRNIPSNAILLNDRYLFANDSLRFDNGSANVQTILNVLLPQRLLSEYYVTIVFDVEKLHSDFTFNDIVERLEEVKQSLHRDYPIVMEVLGINSTCPIYMKLHNRRIVSNYYIVKVEHKLAAFNGNVATAQQSIIPQVLFTVDSLNGHSSPPLKSIEQMTATLRSFSRWTLRISDHSSYSYALNGELMDKCNGIKNRLFK